MIFPGETAPMFAPGASLRLLLEASVRAGRVQWVGVRGARRAALREVDAVELDPVSGIAGDHARSPKRQVTLIDAAALAAIASFLGRAHVDPASLRRNIVVSGINLHALRGARVRIGEAELEITGECHPCSRMEETFGTGGYNAVRGQGGVTARVCLAGIVRRGDAVLRLGASCASTPPA